MANVKTSVKGDVLTVTIDIGKATLDAAQPSKSGKTKIVASTNGAVLVHDDLKLSLNLYR